MIPLSQGHLTLLDACPRKYQYVFFEALSGPATYDQQLTTQWGSQFHLLMQQRALALPVEVLASANEEMAASMAALSQAAPEVFEHLSLPAGSEDSPANLSGGGGLSSSGAPFGPHEFSQSEHRRTFAFNDYLLTVVYDLLVQTPEQGQIFDWKTHQRPPSEKSARDWLQNDWQTRLYLYVLCETTDLNPEQLSMTYWFVRLGAVPSQDALQAAAQEPSFYRFGYSEAQHRCTQVDLLRLTDALSEMRDRTTFPKVDIEQGLCDRCLFNARCDRVATTSASRLSATAPRPIDPQRLLNEARQFTADMVDEIPLF